MRRWGRNPHNTALAISWNDTKDAKEPKRRTFAAAALASMLILGALPAASGGLARTVDELISVIVTSPRGGEGEAAGSVRAAGGTVGKPLGIIGGFEARVPRDALDSLRRSPAVRTVTPNGRVELTARPAEEDIDDEYDPDLQPGDLANVVRLIGAKRLWSEGYRGEGIDVAMIDSGVVPGPALDEENVINGPDLSFESQFDDRRYVDTFGHGTNMAGIIAGNERLGPPRHRFRGVAPSSRVVSVKVAGETGAVDVSQVIAAIDWVVQHRSDDDLNIRVLNLSFGTDGVQDHTLDPLTHAVEVAWRKGIVVVVAAGNAGFGTPQLNNPAHDPRIIAVGAHDSMGTAETEDDIVPQWSSRGNGDRRPDLVAPGTGIVSLRAPGSYLDETYPAARIDDDHFRGSGTSQSAAVISGAAALLLEYRPELTPDQVKDILMETAVPLPSADETAQGSGLIDLRAASDAPVSSTTRPGPASTGLGTLEGARGSGHVVDEDGVELEGEMDIFGSPWDAPTWAEAAESERSWQDGYWNGTAWAGDCWCGTSWTTRSWSTRSWSTRSWSGASWSTTRSWSTRSWSTRSWSTRSWSTRSWS